MVKYKNHTEEPQLDAIFAALSDSTRRAIVARLADGPATVSELAEPFAMSLPAVSKHLKVLEHAGLLDRERAGRTHTMRLDPKAMDTADEWLQRTRAFWESRLDALAHYLDQEEEDKPNE